MSDAWFTWHLAPDGHSEDGCHPQEAAALKTYLHSTTVTPESAARAITQPVIEDPETIHQGQNNKNVYRLWSLLIDALLDLVEHRSRIIHLLQAIQNLPPSVPKEGQPQATHIKWADLPDFGSLWSDLKVSNNWRNGIPKWTPQQRERVRQDYTKQAKIDAQLLVAGISGISILWGLGCICDALERADAVPDFEIPATKEWLEIVGDRIFEESDGEPTGFLRERDLWKPGGGHKQRWKFWKGRLQSLADSAELIPETKHAAVQAVEAMEAVDKVQGDLK